MLRLLRADVYSESKYDNFIEVMTLPKRMYRYALSPSSSKQRKPILSVAVVGLPETQLDNDDNDILLRQGTVYGLGHYVVAAEPRQVAPHRAIDFESTGHLGSKKM